MLRSTLMKEMDKLEHDKKEGFYDKETDIFYDTLEEWAWYKHGIKLHEYL